jgi:phosphatidylinositol kinase/protein kinase (PI-3  family)
VSVASILCYMFGIGDRHHNNILVDLGTSTSSTSTFAGAPFTGGLCGGGEVLHIDFGMAWEQGRQLEYPELVPARLTREVIAGMGAAGPAGAFMSCAEATVRVLRAGASPVLTILSVLLNDPLYRWQCSPQEKARRQLSTVGEGAIAGQASLVSGAAYGGDRGRSASTLRAARAPSSLRYLAPEAASVGGATATAAHKEEESAMHAETTEAKETSALRVLRVVSDKLSGKVLGPVVGAGGERGVLPLQSQVQRILEESQSLPSFAAMYSGWAMWC